MKSLLVVVSVLLLIAAQGYVSTADSLNKQAAAYFRAGRYADAELLLQRAFAIIERARGPEHADTATSLNNLAELYQTIGRYADAEPLYKRALAIREKTLGLEHADTATSLNNLAELYRTIGRHADAEPLYKRALAIREKTLGLEHANTAIPLNNLALLYKAIGRYADAERLYKRALAIWEKALGPEHFYTATSLNNLAELYQTIGRYSDAEPLLQRALAIWEKALGPEHFYTAASLNNLATLYQTTGRYADAESLLQRASAIIEKARGPEHADTATSLNNLAVLYQTTGRYADAELLYKRALAIREKTLGPEHADTATSLNNLALLYKTTGRYADAEPLYQRALSITERALGPKHTDTAGSLISLAELYGTIGRYADAEPLLQRALAIIEKAVGPEHADTATSLNNLAWLYKTTGRYADAESLFKRALAIREKALGPEHAGTAGTLNDLAALYRTTGRYADAESLYKRALTIFEKSLGPEHADTAIYLNNLAWLYLTIGRYADAEPLMKRSLGIAANAGKPEQLLRVQNSYSHLLEKQLNHDAAIFFSKLAVNTIQGLRRNISGLGRDTLKSYDATVEDVYRRLARLLIDRDRIPEAERVLELLKEQEYFQFVRRDARSDDMTSREAPLTSFESKQEKLLDDAAKPLRDQASRMNELKVNRMRTPEQDEELERLEERFRKVADDYGKVVQAVARNLSVTRSDKLEELNNTQSIQSDLRKLGEGNGLVALYTVVDGDDYSLILITSDYRKAYRVKADGLSGKIVALREKLRNPGLDPRTLAKELHDIILPPDAVKALEEYKADTLIWHLDGPLRYLSLAALYDGRQYLAEKYRITYYNTASRWNLKDRPKQSWNGLGMGVSEEQVVDRFKFKPLIWVPDELMKIIRENPAADGIIPGERYLNGKFTWRTLKDRLADKGKYPLVHIASHFNLVPGNDTQSFLVPGSGEPITLALINQQNALFEDVELLTLSACETAYSGGKDADGREVDGLSILAQRQGAKSIIATLWPVADLSTSLLMQQFYKLREERKLTKGEALRQAQLALLNGTVKPPQKALGEGGAKPEPRSDSGTGEFKSDPDRPYAHPYYWAPFVLMGNWL